jgi:hypothetical protein
MVNYRTYRITGKSPSSSYIKFDLNSSITFSSGTCQSYVYCANKPPFDSYCVGDEIEVDLDKIRYKGSAEDITDTSIVRATYTSSSQQLIRRAESTGKATAGRISGNRYTGEYRQESVSYNRYTGDYCYEYQEQPPK